MYNSEVLKNMLITRLGGKDAEVVFAGHELYTFMTLALARLNRTGLITQWTLDEPLLLSHFPDVIVGWSASMAWMSKVPVEASREFTITDNGVEKTAPVIAQKLIDLAKIEGDTFRLAYDKIAETKRKLIVPNNAVVN
jgi:hypothetical protein